MVLRQQLNLGYRTVWLTHNAKQVRHRVNRLVCEAFNGPAPADKPWALHNDGDRSNNVPSNLRWGDCQDNNQDTAKHGRVGEKTSSAKLTAYDVVVIRAAAEAGRDYRVLAREFDVHPSNIWLILKRRTWKHV